MWGVVRVRVMGPGRTPHLEKGLWRGRPVVDGALLAPVHLVQVPALLHERDEVVPRVVDHVTLALRTGRRGRKRNGGAAVEARAGFQPVYAPVRRPHRGILQHHRQPRALLPAPQGFCP